MVNIVNSNAPLSPIQLKARELEQKLNPNKVIPTKDAAKAAAGKHIVRNILVTAGVILAIGVALLISAAALFLLLNPVNFVPTIVAMAAVGSSLTTIGTILGIAGSILAIVKAVKKRKESVVINHNAPTPPPPPPINLPKKSNT